LPFNDLALKRDADFICDRLLNFKQIGLVWLVTEYFPSARS